MGKKKKEKLDFSFKRCARIIHKKFFFILPAKKEFRPEITASLKAFAIKTGFLAFAIALLINTPSQPNSIAIVASKQYQFQHLR